MEQIRKNMEHTPTPWAHSVVSGGIYGADHNTVIVTGLTSKQEEANAKHIVNCVNSHDALVEAAKTAENWLAEYETGPDTGLEGLLIQLRAAIAKTTEGL